MSQQMWGSGLCDCCSGPDGCLTCLMAYFAPCVQHGYNAEKLQKGEAMCAGDFTMACLGWCGLWCLGVPCLLQMSTRTAIRRKYNIKGSECGDFCIAWCCSPCDLCLQHRQLHLPLPASAAGGHVHPHQGGPAAGIPVETPLHPYPQAPQAMPPQYGNPQKDGYQPPSYQTPGGPVPYSKQV